MACIPKRGKNLKIILFLPLILAKHHIEVDFQRQLWRHEQCHTDFEAIRQHISSFRRCNEYILRYIQKLLSNNLKLKIYRRLLQYRQREYFRQFLFFRLVKKNVLWRATVLRSKLICWEYFLSKLSTLTFQKLVFENSCFLSRHISVFLSKFRHLDIWHVNKCIQKSSNVQM